MRRQGLLLLPLLLPVATAWVKSKERLALAHGVPLNTTQIEDARSAGVRAPEKVRLLRVQSIRLFEHPLLRRLAKDAFGTTAGITLHYGILVRTDCWFDRRLIVHELAHVAQYERLGGIRPFLKIYLRECFAEGYPNGALEKEAIDAAAEITA